MKKIIVIGCPGSGKSTFSRALYEKVGIPLHHLDLMYWNADKITVEKGVFRARLAEALSGEEWIIDGNYGSTMEERMAACDTVFFLDFPLDVCLEGVRARRGKKRSDMPWIETEEDAEFMNLIEKYNDEQRPRVLSLLERYKSGREIYVFKSRREADEFLNLMEKNK